jgi:hypothetical protein
MWLLCEKIEHHSKNSKQKCSTFVLCHVFAKMKARVMLYIVESIAKHLQWIMLKFLSQFLDVFW